MPIVAESARWVQYSSSRYQQSKVRLSRGCGYDELRPLLETRMTMLLQASQVSPANIYSIDAWNSTADLQPFDTALTTVEAAPRMLARYVFAWVDESRRQNRTEDLASALAGVVRTTRYGCRRNGSLGAVSFEAFRRLHRDFPKSSWARQTPYWFDLGR